MPDLFRARLGTTRGLGSDELIVAQRWPGSSRSELELYITGPGSSIRSRGLLMAKEQEWGGAELQLLDDALVVWGSTDTLRTLNADLPGPPVELGAWEDGLVHSVQHSNRRGHRSIQN
ncbi:MAG: hypothetical protein CME06_07450 [Gemmatimonadetes bacterium]|nr:hypothetical protein [Gemmatimonadota bacterium]